MHTSLTACWQVREQVSYTVHAIDQTLFFRHNIIAALERSGYVFHLMIRALYDRTLAAAQGKHALPLLILVSFAESSVFPLPPDLILLPMCLANRARAWLFAFACTIASVAGAWGGYALGAFAFSTIGQAIINTYNLHEGFNAFQEGFNEWGVLIILAKGLTPIPFKLVTIASGVAHLNLVSFTLACAFTRALRFFLVAGLAFWFGEPVKAFVERYLTWVLLGFLIAIVLGFWMIVS